MLVFCSITKEIGVSEEIVHIWYLRCKKHGLNAFETSNKNHSYSKDFKLSKKNILVRDFKANVPNEKWLTDITEFSISGDSRKLYLSPILDLYDNSIITYEISFKNNNKLIFKMLDKAIQKYPDAKPIFHSDRGFQYTNNTFKSKIQKVGMTKSMFRVGKCIDNGHMKGFFCTLKAEMFYGKIFKSLEELRDKIIEYTNFTMKKGCKRD